jgi:hypothetical protein
MRAVGAVGHQPQPGQPLQLTADTEPLAGMQRAALRLQSAVSGSAPLGPEADHQHGRLHPPRPPHERHGCSSAPAAGTAGHRVRWRGRRKRRWRGNGWWSDATHNRPSLAAGFLIDPYLTMPDFWQGRSTPTSRLAKASR